MDSGFSSIALNGRGGAIVPNKMLASCLALPPAALSSSSEELSDSATDQSSSSSGLARDLRSSGPGRGVGAVKADDDGFSCFSCWARRWNGLVDWSSVVDGAEVASEAWDWGADEWPEGWCDN